MKYSILFILTFFLSSAFDHPTDTVDNEFESIAIVELFTSQGCSSCPSADKVLSKLVEQAQIDHLPIYGLSFHVSYWNRLGWKDPFSKEVYTNRQRKYGATLNTSSIYTPQMIVNGKDQFVGSSEHKANLSVKSALEQKAKTVIALNTLELSNGQVSVNYKLTGLTDDTFLNIALVERGLENYVPRGENKGLTLKHDNVVRSFKTIYPEASGKISLELPSESIDPKNSSLIVYIQNKRNLEVYGASRMSIN